MKGVRGGSFPRNSAGGTAPTDVTIGGAKTAHGKILSNFWQSILNIALLCRHINSLEQKRSVEMLGRRPKIPKKCLRIIRSRESQQNQKTAPERGVVINFGGSSCRLRGIFFNFKLVRFFRLVVVFLFDINFIWLFF